MDEVQTDSQLLIQYLNCKLDFIASIQLNHPVLIRHFWRPDFGDGLPTTDCASFHAKENGI